MKWEFEAKNTYIRVLDVAGTYILLPQKRSGFPGGGSGSCVRPKHLKKCMELKLEFPGGEGEGTNISWNLHKLKACNYKKKL